MNRFNAPRPLVALLILLAVALLVACNSPTKPKTPAGFSFTVVGDTAFFRTTVEVPEGDVVSWDFGDGATGTGESTSHRYLGSGRYNVSQKIGNSAPAEGTVIIEDPPQCSIDIVRTSPASLCVQFINESTNFSPGTTGHRSEWSFGDGDNSADDEPNHCYDFAGVYNATLRVFNTRSQDTCGRSVIVPN